MGGHFSLTPILRGCYLSSQPEHVYDTPNDLSFDVTHFVKGLHEVLVSELESHGFVVSASPRTFTVACVHLAFFTQGKEAPDQLRISWHPGVEAPIGRRPVPPVVRLGNLTMICAICQEDRPMQTISPCGHLICGTCWASASGAGYCPFCRGIVVNVHPLFVP